LVKSVSHAFAPFFYHPHSASFSGILCTTKGGLLSVVQRIPPLICWGIGSLMDTANKRSIERDIEKANRQVGILKLEADAKFKLKVKEFMGNHSL
jgi:hypothetical protein